MMTLSETDAVLLDRFRSERDADAFTELVQRYQNFVYATCLRVLNDAVEAEDVAQECFLKLARKAETVGPSVGNWLHRVATTMAIDARRRAAARARKHAAATVPDSTPDEITFRELTAKVDAAIDQLPDEQRRLVTEHFLRHRPQAELAAEMQVSTATVSRRVADALELLRTHLSEPSLAVTGALTASVLAAGSLASAPATLTLALGKLALAVHTLAPVPAAVAPIAGGKIAMYLAASMLLVAVAVIAARSILHAIPAAGGGQVEVAGDDKADQKTSVDGVFDDSLALKDGAAVHVDSRSGSIYIHAIDGEQVVVHAVKKISSGSFSINGFGVNITVNGYKVNGASSNSGGTSDDLKAVKIQTSTDPNGDVRVHTEYPATPSNVSVDYDIGVPRYARIGKISETNGSITIEGAQGDPDLETTNGKIQVTGTAGFVSANSSNGQITVRGVKGIKHLESTNGAITAEVQALAGNDVSISTSNGAIRLELNPALDCRVSAETTNGALRADGFPELKTKRGFTGGELSGTLGKGGASLSVETTNGAINLDKL